MAETVWTGAVDGDWGNDGNWSGVEPVTGDDAIFNYTSSTSVTSGVDNDGVNLASLIIHEGYQGDIASTGSPLIITADLVEHRGSGTLYYKNGSTAFPAITDVFRMNSNNQANAVELDGQIGQIELIKGNGLTKATLNAATILVSFRSDQANDVIFTMAKTSDTPFLLMGGGRVFCNDDLEATTTGLVVTAGRFTSLSSATVTNVWQTGGTIAWKSSAGIAGTVYAIGGLFDLSQDGRAKTINELHKFPGADVRLNNAITITTLNNLDETTDTC